MQYDDALDDAFEAMPEHDADAGTRLSVPDPEGETDGSFTRLTNISAMAEALGRDPDHLHRFLQRTFGTNGQFDGNQARYNGSFSVADFDAAVDEYAAEYVLCSECGLPDTVLAREDGVDMLRCEACGAFRPVQKRTSPAASARTETIEEGETYELEITGTGRKGDGVAERGSYTIFVPGAREGDTVRVVIEDTSGNLAFARKL